MVKSKKQLVQKTATKRWQKNKSWDKIRFIRRKLRASADGDKKPIRFKNNTINKHRRHYYTKGDGQLGIGIPNSRAINNIRKCLVETTQELRYTLGATFYNKQWHICRGFSDTIRAALDQYANLIWEVAYEIATARQPESLKSATKTQGFKCRLSDVKKAILMIQQLSK